VALVLAGALVLVGGVEGGVKGAVDVVGGVVVGGGVNVPGGDVGTVDVGGGGVVVVGNVGGWYSACAADGAFCALGFDTCTTASTLFTACDTTDNA
jgi:hypothetical protein